MWFAKEYRLFDNTTWFQFLNPRHFRKLDEKSQRLYITAVIRLLALAPLQTNLTEEII